MSRQRKGPERRVEVDRVQQGPEAAESVSNDAARAELTPLEGADPVRDAAAPLIGGAQLALQVTARPPEQLARLVDVLSRSNLPGQELLIGRLEGAQALAQDVSDALSRWFGEDTPALRDQLSDALSAIQAGIDAGQATDGGWTIGDHTIALPGADAALRAERLVDALASEHGGRDHGARLTGLCRELQLLALFDEDEDEALLGDQIAEEQG